MKNTVRGFWHLQMQPGKVYDKSCNFPLLVTHAVLDMENFRGKGDVDIIQVRVVHGQAPKVRETTVANLSVKLNVFQVPVNLSFGVSDNVKFKITGAKVPVNLIGVMEEEVSDIRGSEVSQKNVVQGKRERKNKNGVAGKRARLDTGDELLQQIKNDDSIPEVLSGDEEYDPLEDEKMPEDPELDDLPAKDKDLRAPNSTEDEDQNEEDEDDYEDEKEKESGKEDGNSDSEDEVEDEGTTLDEDECDSDDIEDMSVDLGDCNDCALDSKQNPEEASPVQPVKLSKLSKRSTPKPTKAPSGTSAMVKKSDDKLKPQGTPKQIVVKKVPTPKPGKRGALRAEGELIGEKVVVKISGDKPNASKLGSAQKKGRKFE